MPVRTGSRSVRVGAAHEIAAAFAKQRALSRNQLFIAHRTVEHRLVIPVLSGRTRLPVIYFYWFVWHVPAKQPMAEVRLDFRHKAANHQRNTQPWIYGVTVNTVSESETVES